jgi:hypothetical protein
MIIEQHRSNVKGDQFAMRIGYTAFVLASGQEHTMIKFNTLEGAFHQWVVL